MPAHDHVMPLALITLAIALAVGACSSSAPTVNEPTDNGSLEASPPSETATTTESEPTREPETQSPDLAVCKAKRKAFAEIVSGDTACDDDSDCNVYKGNCEIGLGGCFAAVNTAGANALAALRDEYRAAGCSYTGGVCRCVSSPSTAVCDSGRCVVAP